MIHMSSTYLDFHCFKMFLTVSFGIKEELVRLLDDGKCNVNARIDDGSTPLHIAVQNKKEVDIVKILLSYGADPNIADNEGKTPLHYAVEYGLMDITRLLLDHNADPRIKDKYGDTPLHYAVKLGNLNITKIILEKRPGSVNVKNNDGLTPLHYAVVNGDVDMVKLLLQYNADVFSLNNAGRSALHYAIRIGSPEIIELMQSYIRGARITPVMSSKVSQDLWLVKSQNKKLPNKIEEISCGRAVGNTVLECLKMYRDSNNDLAICLENRRGILYEIYDKELVDRHFNEIMYFLKLSLELRSVSKYLNPINS